MKARYAVTLALMAASAYAQERPPRPTATPLPRPTASPTPEGPKPPPELTKLQFLVGDWIHEEVHHAAPAGGGLRGAARSKSVWILGGHRLYLTYKSLGPGGEYEGRGLMGWEPEEKAYRLDWFDSRGLAQRYTG